MKRILNAINNYFYKSGEMGQFEIKDNKIKVKGDYIEGQYISTEGSIMNDNVFKVESFVNGEITLKSAHNEVFEGCIYSLAIPMELIELLPIIDEFEDKNKANGLASESFGGYAYSVATNSHGEQVTWKDAYKNILTPYRKIYNNKRGVKYI